jgi:hypothetical protein
VTFTWDVKQNVKQNVVKNSSLIIQMDCCKIVVSGVYVLLKLCFIIGFILIAPLLANYANLSSEHALASAVWNTVEIAITFCAEGSSIREEKKKSKSSDCLILCISLLMMLVVAAIKVAACYTGWMYYNYRTDENYYNNYSVTIAGAVAGPALFLIILCMFGMRLIASN